MLVPKLPKLNRHRNTSGEYDLFNSSLHDSSFVPPPPPPVCCHDISNPLSSKKKPREWCSNFRGITKLRFLHLTQGMIHSSMLPTASTLPKFCRDDCTWGKRPHVHNFGILIEGKAAGWKWHCTSMWLKEHAMWTFDRANNNNNNNKQTNKQTNNNNNFNSNNKNKRQKQA